MKGTTSATMTFFPEGVMDTMMVRTVSINVGTKVSVNVYELERG
jgi:hypothetical protein